MATLNLVGYDRKVAGDFEMGRCHAIDDRLKGQSDFNPLMVNLKVALRSNDSQCMQSALESP